MEETQEDFQGVQHAGGAANRTVGQTVRAFEPDQFAAEEGQGLKRPDCFVDARGGGGGVVGGSVDDFQAELARVRRGQAFRQFARGGLDRAFVTAKNSGDIFGGVGLWFGGHVEA